MKIILKVLILLAVVFGQAACTTAPNRRGISATDVGSSNIKSASMSASSRRPHPIGSNGVWFTSKGVFRDIPAPALKTVLGSTQQKQQHTSVVNPSISREPPVKSRNKTDTVNRQPIVSQKVTVAPPKEPKFTPYVNVGANPLIPLRHHRGGWTKLTKNERVTIEAITCQSKEGCLTPQERRDFAQMVKNSREDPRVTVEFFPQGYRFAVVSGAVRNGKPQLSYNREWQGKEPLTAIVYHLPSGRNLIRIYKCGNWSLGHREVPVEVPVQPQRKVAPVVSPASKVPVAEALPSSQEGCVLDPTAFVLAGDVWNRSNNAVFTHGYGGLHCMSPLGDGKYIGGGVVAAHNWSDWNGRGGDGKTFNSTTSWLRGGPSMKYVDLNLGVSVTVTPAVGVFENNGQGGDGRYRMNQGMTTAGLQVHVDRLSVDEHGLRQKGDEAYLEFGVPIGQWKSNSWDGKSLSTGTINNIKAIILVGVRHYLATYANPDMPFEGVRIFAQVDGFAILPDTLAIGAYLGVSDIRDRIAIKLGPSISLETGQVSLLVTIEVDLTQVVRVWRAQARTAQTIEELDRVFGHAEMDRKPNAIVSSVRPVKQ